MTPDETEQEQTGGRSRRRRGKDKKPRSFWREIPILIVVALLLSFLLQTFIARVYLIPSESMEPTLHGCPGCTGDRIVVEKISYRFGDPKPGDVVVFRGPDRVVATLTFDFDPEGRISTIHNVANPDKLHAVADGTRHELS